MKNLITKIFFICSFTFLSNQLLSQSISLVSAAATTNQTLCVNSTITEIKYLSTGGVTDVTVSGLPNGISGVYNAGLYTINGSPTETGIFTYTITTVGGANAAVTSQGTLTIDGSATASQGWESTLCLNSTASISDIAVSPGTYLWTHDGLGSLANNTTMTPVYTPVQGDVGNIVTLTLTVTSNNSCPTSTATSTFTYKVRGVPSFTGNLYTYVGATTQLNGSPGKHQYYPWMSSDGSVATIDNNGLVTGVGLGSTTITYQDTNFCSVSKTLDVVTLITPSILGNLTFCSGSTSQLTGTETAMANNPWTSSNTGVATVSNTGIVTGITAGTSAITYMNSTGGTATVNVVIKETPSVTVNSSTICSGSFAIVSATPSNTGGTYLWGGNETTQNITVNPTSTTNYTVIYTLNGCSSNQGLGVVTVNPIPSVNAGADLTVCSGTSVTLSGSGAQSYSWSNSITNGTSFIPSVSTNYTLTGTSNGCSATDVVNITVNTTPNLVITNPAAVCSPNTIDVTSPAVTSGSTGGGTLSYWTDLGCTSILGSPTSIINAGPIYIKSTLGACSDVKQVTVIINSQPSISGNLSTYATSTTQLTGSATAAVNTPWLSSNTGIATVSNTGLVTGIASGSSTITYTNNNGCSNTALVTVGALNTITLTSAIGSDNQTICANTPITNITYTTTGASNANFSGLPSGITGNWISNSITLSGTVTIPGTYNYIITLIGGNGSITKSGSIVVNTRPSLSISNPAAVCSPSTIDLTNAGITSGSSGGGTLTYWTDAATTTALVNPSAIASSGTYYIKSTLGACSDVKSVVVTINSQPVISGILSTFVSSTTQLNSVSTAAVNSPWVSSNTVVATISNTGLVTGVSAGNSVITFTNNNGCSNTATITVGALNTIVLSSSFGTDNQTICANSSITNITYSTTGATGAIFSGLPNGVGGSWSNNIVSITGTPSVSGTFNYIVTLTGGNGTIIQNGTIIINPINTINLSSALGTENQTVCINTLITDIKYATTGASGANHTGLPSGVSGNFNNNQITLSGTPTVSGIFNYSITLTGGCGTIIKTGTIIIDALPTASIGGTQTICGGETAIITGAASTNGTIIWSHQGLGSITNGTTLTPSYTSTLGEVGNTIVLTMTVTSNNSCSLNSSTANISITIQNCAAPVLSITNPYPVCSPTTVDITSSQITVGSTNVGTLTYWSDASGTIILPNPTTISNSGTYYIKATNGNGSDIKPVVVTINQTPNLTITNPAAVCSPNTVDLTSSSITLGSTNMMGGPITYWTDILGTNPLANPSSVSVSGTYYLKIYNTSCSDLKPVIVTINTTPSLVITNPAAVTAPATVDITASSITAGSTGNGTITYWINPEASVSLSNPASVSMSGTYYIKSDLGNCSDTNFVTVTINKVSSPTTQLSAYVIPNGISQNGICDGSAEVVVTTGTAPYTYLFSDISTNSKAVSLCDGLKSVRVTDANKDTLYINFIISSPGNLTTTNTFIDSTIIDSVFNNVITNCILNYSLIDSAKIDNYTILPNDSITLNWKIYTGNSFVVVTNVYSMNIISSAGVYSFALQIYCPNKLSGNFLTAYDQLYITTIDISSTSIKEVKLNDYSIFPNPFSEQIVIKSKSNINCVVELTDLTGKVLLIKSISENDAIINTKDLNSGNYLLIIKNDETIKTFKVCK